MGNKKYSKNNIYNNDFYLDTYDAKLEKLIYKNIIAEEIVNNMCESFDDDASNKYQQQIITLKRIEKHIENTKKENQKILNILNKLEDELSDEDYMRIDKEQWMNRHRYMYFNEFTQVLNEIKDYVPCLIEGQTEYYNLQGYNMNPKLIKLDKKYKYSI